MITELIDIKKLRKKLGVSQIALAKKAQVSQSLIAKVESGLLDPSFSNAQKIFSALEDIGNKKAILAKEIMQTRIISVKPTYNIKSVVAKMKKYEISQMPVIEENNVCVGIVNDKLIIDFIINNKDDSSVLIKEIMEEVPPIINENAKLDVFSNLLKHYSLVLVAKKGKLKGIITKADVITKVKY